MQQRALIEPRVRVMYVLLITILGRHDFKSRSRPKKRRARVVEYEKHAWKRFE